MSAVQFPRRVTSTATTITVQSPAGWGTGATTGTVVGDVWTPGRESPTSPVNLASWNIVPTGRWIEVAGTQLDSLDSVVKAAVPGWSDWGNGINGSKWNATLQAWNGMAWDTRTGTERGWIAASGGHVDSSNDGVYGLDLRKMAWAVERNPMSPAYWASSYASTGSYTDYTPAQTYYNSSPSNAEGVFSDEFYDPAYPSDPLRSPRTPTARHTYGSLVFVPSLGASGKILMNCRRYWEYDLATKTWSVPKFTNNQQTPIYQAAENMCGWWNDSEQRYYVTGVGGGDGKVTWSVQPGGAGWRNEGGFPTGGYASEAATVELYGTDLWTVNFKAGFPTYQTGAPQSIYRQRLSDRVTTLSATVSWTTQSLGGKSMTTGGWDGQGSTYVASTGEMLTGILYSTGAFDWAWIAPSGALRAAGIGGSIPATASSRAIVETKIKYLPALNAVVWVHGATDNIRILRL